MGLFANFLTCSPNAGSIWASQGKAHPRQIQVRDREGTASAGLSQVGGPTTWSHVDERCLRKRRTPFSRGKGPGASSVGFQRLVVLIGMNVTLV